jgi:hypothetical protein
VFGGKHMEYEILRTITWTPKEQKKLKDTYFEILRITEEYYELQSKNTGHLWIIKKQCIGRYPVILYHKHSKKISYYHKQRGVCTVSEAIKTIKEHDEYMQRR